MEINLEILVPGVMKINIFETHLKLHHLSISPVYNGECVLRLTFLYNIKLFLLLINFLHFIYHNKGVPLVKRVRSQEYS